MGSWYMGAWVTRIWVHGWPGYGCMGALKRWAVARGSRWRRRLAGILLLAGLLRLLRVILRWDEPVFDYAYYHLPLMAALQKGAWSEVLSQFAGLHPPLYSLFFAGLSTLSPAPLGWLLASALFSWGAVWLVAVGAFRSLGARAGMVAGLWMAVSPVQLAYAAEVNGYPLLVFALAGLLYASARVVEAPDAWRWRMGLIWVGALSAWVHILGGVAAVAVFLAAPGTWRRRGGTLLLAGVLWLPLMHGAWQRAQEPGTYAQPALALSPRLLLLRERFGIPGGLAAILVLLALGWWGIQRRMGAKKAGSEALTPAGDLGGGVLQTEVAEGRMAGTPATTLTVAVACLMALLISLSCFLYAGIAAPHQFPYLVAMGPPAAWCVAGLPRRGFMPLMVLLLGLGVWQGAVEAGKVQEIWRDQTQVRAVDRALEMSRPGDALWLLTPYQPDDDKRGNSPVLWRFPPWKPMPAAWEPGAGEAASSVDPLDFRYGTPRRMDGRTVHVFTRVFPAQMAELARQRLAAGGRVFVVLYDQQSEPGLARDLTQLFGQLSLEIGRAHV